jgi:hypothetical protein
MRTPLDTAMGDGMSPRGVTAKPIWNEDIFGPVGRRRKTLSAAPAPATAEPSDAIDQNVCAVASDDRPDHPWRELFKAHGSLRFHGGS